MGFLKNYRDRRTSLTGPDTVATLTAIERFFQGGRNWTRGEYHRMNGKKCIVGAVQSERVGAIEDARYWIRQAIIERHPGFAWLPAMQIESFNDSRFSYSEIAEIIARAKELALGAARQSPPARGPAPEILPPLQRPALTHQPESERPTVKLTLADLERVAVKRRD